MKRNKLQILAVQNELIDRGALLFTPQEFGRIFCASFLETKYFLETNTKKGLFIRLKKGLYGLKRHIPNEEEIANALYGPSYISFEYALAKYGIIPEMSYSITSATTKPTRIFNVVNKTFSYSKVKKHFFTGYIPVKKEGRVFLIAEPEKALIDYLYFVSLGKKTYNDRLNTAGLDKEKIIRYAGLFERSGLIKLLKNYDLQ